MNYIKELPQEILLFINSFLNGDTKSQVNFFSADKYLQQQKAVSLRKLYGDHEKNNNNEYILNDECFKLKLCIIAKCYDLLKEIPGEKIINKVKEIILTLHTNDSVKLLTGILLVNYNKFEKPIKKVLNITNKDEFFDQLPKELNREKIKLLFQAMKFFDIINTGRNILLIGPPKLDEKNYQNFSFDQLQDANSDLGRIYSQVTIPLKFEGWKKFTS